MYKHQGKLNVKPGVNLPRGFPTQGKVEKGIERKMNIPAVNPERRLSVPRRGELRVIDPHTGKTLPRTY